MTTLPSRSLSVIGLIISMGCSGYPHQSLKRSDAQLEESRAALRNPATKPQPKGETRAISRPKRQSVGTETSSFEARRCAPMPKGNLPIRVARQQAFLLAERKADAVISEFLQSNVKSEILSQEEGRLENEEFKRTGIDRLRITVTSFMSADGRALVMTVPASQKCERGQCCVTRMLPTEDALAGIESDLQRELNMLRSIVAAGLASDASMVVHYPKAEETYQRIRQLRLKKRAIDKQSPVRLSDGDQNLWKAFQTRMLTHGATLKIVYSADTHPSLNRRSSGTKLIESIMRSGQIKAPLRATKQPSCRDTWSHLVVLEIHKRKLWKAPEAFGPQEAVTIPMHLILYECPAQDEIARWSLPKKMIRVESDQGTAETEGLIWNRLEGIHLDELQKSASQFLSKELGFPTL